RRADLLVAVRGDAEALARGALLAGAPPASVLFVADAQAAEAAVAERLAPGDALFVKGSRGVGLDRLVDALAPEAAP
ncbi:MAG: UDP-N-acetylmuramoyl-tripeptide--D-alanyl-D-alanine ligase, partial [Acidobacteria bacterium ACB2]|nr:UDP-N-acetylmuramoyl-tripeptide--D-alanyl-D-alanine ligase [Acidobacteria bacterium ACB2]